MSGSAAFICVKCLYAQWQHNYDYLSSLNSLTLYLGWPVKSRMLAKLVYIINSFDGYGFDGLIGIEKEDQYSHICIPSTLTEISRFLHMEKQWKLKLSHKVLQSLLLHKWAHQVETWVYHRCPNKFIFSFKCVFTTAGIASLLWVFRILIMHHRDTGILLPMDYHKLTTRQITRSNAQQYVKISVVCWVYVNREMNHLCFWNLSKTVNFSPRKLAALPKFFSLQSLTNTYAINVVDRMLFHDSKKIEMREDACGYSHCPTNMA